MSRNKLLRQLRREATANPKKAAILGVLVLVALYFWGPLVWGWVVSEEGSVEPPSSDAEQSQLDRLVADADLTRARLHDTGSTPPRTPQNEEEKACPYPWTQLDAWMKEDPMTTPAEDVATWRDPFATVVSAEEMREREAAPAEAAQVTSETLEVELTGTLIGPRRRVAMIGGKAYREGQTLAIDQSGRPVELRLVEVHPRRIVLEYEGNRLELAIPERSTGGKIELVRPSTVARPARPGDA
jgi:hypothetical protein